MAGGEGMWVSCEWSGCEWVVEWLEASEVGMWVSCEWVVEWL